jgi:hypothetical protein
MHKIDESIARGIYNNQGTLIGLTVGILRLSKAAQENTLATL